MTIVGITGSAGKSTTKDLLGEMLASARQTLRTRRDDNCVYGVPATLLAIRSATGSRYCELGRSGSSRAQRGPLRIMGTGE